MNEHYLATRIRGMGTTIFTEMSALAAQYGAVNLGQAFPDFAGFDVAKEAARTAIANDLNQYAPMTGQPALRQALAEHAARFYNMTIDPQAHITITAGATEAIFATLLGLVNPGDEVVLFEPFYDSYRPAVEMAGGNVRVVTLRPPTFAPDPDELRAAFSARTKAIVVNTPHNPTSSPKKNCASSPSCARSTMLSSSLMKCMSTLSLRDTAMCGWRPCPVCGSAPSPSAAPAKHSA